MDKLNLVFDTLINSHFVYAMGWTILHSIWQASLIGIILAASLSLTKCVSANTRYLMAVAALLSSALLSIITFASYYQSINGLSALGYINLTATQLVYQQDWWTSLFTLVNPYLNYVVGIWLMGLVIQLFRFSLDYFHCQKLKHEGCLNMPLDWQQKTTQLAEQMGILGKINIKLSHLVNVPCVIGHFKPIVLFPVELFTRLPREQIEAILLHELAHIKRHDYLVNLLQCVLKSTFFYHPIVLWMATKVDIERENACDDIALKHCGSALLFAQSLSSVADTDNSFETLLAVSKNRFGLLNRVKRLFVPVNKLSNRTENLVSILFIACLGMAVNVNADNSLVNHPIYTSETEVEPELTTLTTAKPDAKSIEPSEQSMQKNSSQSPSIQKLSTPTTQSEQKVTISDENSSFNSFVTASTSPSANTTDIKPINRKTASISTQNLGLRVAADSAIDFATFNSDEQKNQKKPSNKTSLSNNQEEGIYQLVDTEFQRVLIDASLKYTDYDGIIFAPSKFADVGVESNLTTWINKINGAIPKIETQINQVFERFNNKTHNSNSKRPLLVYTTVHQISHIYAGETIYDYKPSATDTYEQTYLRWRRNVTGVNSASGGAIWRSHRALISLRFVLIDSLNKQPVGLVQHKFWLGSGNGKGIKGKKVSEWENNLGENVWQNIAKFATNNLHSDLEKTNSQQRIKISEDTTRL